MIVLGISVSFWLNQVSTNNQNNNERIKVLNSLQKEAKEINDYCAERMKNWQNDIAILNAFIGIIALGILITVRVPNPNMSSDNIKINVIKPIKIDLIVVTTI